MGDMQIEHTEDGECINLKSDKDIKISADHDEDITIKNNRTIKVLEGTHTETIKGDTTIKVTDGKLDHYVAKAVKETFDDTQDTYVKNGISITSGTAHIYIHGCTNIQLHVGASQLWMAADGNIMLKGKHVQIIGSSKVEIKGGEVVSHADGNHEIKGSKVLSHASMTNTVEGLAVMLNP